MTDSEKLIYLTSRSLDDNIRDLIAAAPTTDHTLLLVRYNTLLKNMHSQTQTEEYFNAQMNRLWESFMFFYKKQNDTVKNRISSSDSTKPESQTILFVSAVPDELDYLSTNVEFAKIKTAADSSNGKLEVLVPLTSVTMEEFLSEKHKKRPAIVHFSGHGEQEGLMFATGSNSTHLVRNDVLQEMFKGAQEYVKCIFLNACYASAQAKILSANGIYVIGMRAQVSDPVSLSLAENFYRYLAEGQDIPTAFTNTRTILMSHNQEESKTPELWRNGQLN